MVVLNVSKSNLFPIKILSDATPCVTTDITQTRSKAARLNENFIDETRNNEKDINSDTFNEYFGYQNLYFLAKKLITTISLKRIK